LTKRMRPVFMDRMEAWSAFAAAKEMITTELQPFDLFYICRKEAEHHYDGERGKRFGQTGRALQLLLSQSPYRDVTVPWAPMYAADWDAADLLPAFTQFFIYKPNLLNVLSSKHLVRVTGE
uniref:Uncharacterized protein n=1 Tax=Parascaris univalens TaxID=6257 RepID=A0A915CHN0_PARUN